MEGKRFGLGLVAGLLVALALVTVSGGLGSTPMTMFSVARGGATPAAASTVSSSTVSSTTVAISATTTATQTATGTETGSAPWGSLNATSPYTSSTTATASVTSSSTASQPGQTTATNTGNGLTYFTGAAVSKEPSQLASIAKQPIVSDAEILAPVLVAFLLGAFLYRVAVQERERSSSE